MFSGIIETTSQVLKVSTEASNLVRIVLQKPSNFNDLSIGDSVAVNGVCLTVESFDDQVVSFALAAETLKVLKIETPQNLLGQFVNLERSLRFGDRVHGHLVTGHVESLGKILRSEEQQGSWFLDVQVADKDAGYIWPKGSITLHGVSLTVNSLEKNVVGVCLIPETTQRTNLAKLPVGSWINIETDYLAKAYFNWQKRQHETTK